MADVSAGATMATMPISSAGGVDGRAIYVEHGPAMRAAAIALLGGPDKEILGKSAESLPIEPHDVRVHYVVTDG